MNEQNNMSDEFLTAEDYLKILQNFLQTNQVKFVRANLAPSKTGEGFLGEYYSLIITYKIDETENEKEFFIKTKPRKSEVQREIVTTSNSYGREIFVYGFLLAEFEKMGYYTDFAPKCYYCKNEDTIVMENVTLKGFLPPDKRKCFDIHQCKAALDALAYFHANSIAYEETKSKQLGKTYILKDEKPDIFDEMFYKIDEPDAVSSRYAKTTTECFENLSELMPESMEWKASFVEKVNSFDTAKHFWQPLPYRKTITHGDLWSSNLLMKYSNNIAVQCCLLDFQLLRHHHPGFDVLLVMYTNTRRDFRKKHIVELLDYYYEKFELILKRNGFDAGKILPKDHFLKVIEALKNVALIQAATTRTLTLLPSTIIKDAVNAGGEKLGELYLKDRPRLVLECFKNDEECRNIIMDDMYDLYEQL